MKTDYTREEILTMAKGIVCKDRDADYGKPEDNFRKIAGLWTAYLDGSDGNLTSYDVAVMMILMKIARVATNPVKLDSWVDIAGYAACGGEIAAVRREASDV